MTEWVLVLFVCISRIGCWPLPGDQAYFSSQKECKAAEEKYNKTENNPNGYAICILDVNAEEEAPL